MAMSDIPHDLHEGSWLYVSAHVHPLDRVLAVCRSHGWSVIVGSEELGPRRRAQALRMADACIVDASTSWPHAEDELSLAVEQRRPVVVLCQTGCTTQSAPAGSDGVRELAYEDGEECARALDRLLMDPNWRRHVALAAPADHA